MVELSEQYQTRTIRFLDVWCIEEWKLKAYGIVYGAAALEQRLIRAAYQTAVNRIETTGRNTNHYAVGFVGVHQGRTGNFVFVDWWADENELHHHVYVSPSGAPDALVYMTPTGLTACAWDLILIGHERNAWVRNVLAAPDTPDLDGYLRTRLNAEV